MLQSSQRIVEIGRVPQIRKFTFYQTVIRQALNMIPPMHMALKSEYMVMAVFKQTVGQREYKPAGAMAVNMDRYICDKRGAVVACFGRCLLWYSK